MYVVHRSRVESRRGAVGIRKGDFFLDFVVTWVFFAGTYSVVTFISVFNLYFK